MTSVTRFIRQVPVATTYYDAYTVTASPATTVYEFVPTAANYVGNYPPGYVQLAPAALQGAITTAVAYATATQQRLVLRDMGKTIYAPISSLTGVSGYFRQVQLLSSSGVSASQGLIGGAAGNNFGVIGAPANPDAYTNYLTFYIPVTVAGVNAIGVNTGAYVIAGGQM